jgi:hypothetical protein
MYKHCILLSNDLILLLIMLTAIIWSSNITTFSPYNFMYIVDAIVRLVVLTWWYKINCLFRFHVFNIQSCKYGIYKGFSRNIVTNRLVPRFTRKISDETLTGILDIQFFTHFCMNASKVCLYCLYFNLVTVLTDLCPGLRWRAMYLRQVWGEYPH